MSDATGRPYPLGATVCSDGTNFSILSASATGMQLILFRCSIAPRITGMSLCPESNLDNCMAIGQMALSILRLGSASMLKKS